MSGGLKERELIALGPCAHCGKPLLGEGITFYKVSITRAMFDRGAIERRAGLQMMLGVCGVVARAMGPDENLATVFDGPHEVAVHEHCAHELRSLLLLIPEDRAKASGGNP